MAKNNKDGETLYIITANVYDSGESTNISQPMTKEDADRIAGNLRDSMKEIESEYKVFDKISVKKYTDEVLYDSGKDDPYDYTVLDALDKKIKGGFMKSDDKYKITDEFKKSDKVKVVKGAK